MTTSFSGLSLQRLTALLDAMQGVRAGLLGDVCLDVYWEADMRRSELSRETPHFPLPIVGERMQPGAGGNAALNLASLGLARVSVAGVVGQDWRAGELVRCLGGIDASRLVTTPRVVTNAYCKPMRRGLSHVVYEDPRLDFANYAPPDACDEQALLDALEDLAKHVDVLCVSDQFAYGVVTPRVRARVSALAAEGLRVVVDSRDRIGLFSHAILKPNEIEGVRAAGGELREDMALEDFAAHAQALAGISGGPVVMTLGAKGSLVAVGGQTTHIAAAEMTGPLDICGAGDSFLAGLSASLAAGASLPEAACVAGLCSEVTIQKIGMTGTAGREEVLHWHAVRAQT